MKLVSKGLIIAVIVSFLLAACAPAATPAPAAPAPRLHLRW